MSVDVNQLFEMLASDEESIQQQGLEEAAKVRYLSIFILPIESKGLWENCAKILASKTDEELKRYLIPIFDWFRDANWPGFDVICERFRKLPAQFILSDYSYMINRAQEEPKDDCKMWLTYLSGLIANPELLALLPPRQQRMMKKYYRKWWMLQK